MKNLNEKYSGIRGTLGAFFSSESSISSDAVDVIYERLRTFDPDAIEVLRAELKLLFSDPDVDWYKLGFNDEYEIDMSEEAPSDVRKFVIDNLWNRFFPDHPPPLI